MSSIDDDPFAVTLSDVAILTHKDLGIAYLEIGLYQDAMREFQLVRSAPGEEAFGAFMIGRCWLRTGNRAEAIAHLEQALALTKGADRQMVEQDLAAAHRLAPVDRASLKRLLDHPAVPRRGDALELGCGTGEVLFWLAQLGYQVSGIDISPVAIAAAKKRCSTVGKVWAHLQVGDVVKLAPFEDSSFDLVVDARCLHCLIGADRIAALRSVRRVLRPGGVLLVETMVNDPTAPEVLELFDKATRCVVRDGVAVRYLGRAEDVVREIERQRFRVVASWVQPPVGAGDQDELLVVALRN